MKKLVLSESRFDFKYQSILGKISGLEVKEGKFLELLLLLLIKKKSFYHIRYIVYRGVIVSGLRLFTIWIAAKFSNSKVIWTCHNIYEHNIPSKWKSIFLMWIVSKISTKIIVFHRDLIHYLPYFAQKKVAIACFGEFRTFIESRSKDNSEFYQLYKNWVTTQNCTAPDLISISAAKRSNLELFIESLKNSNLNTLIIAPKRDYNGIFVGIPNVFYYNENFVEKEVSLILSSNPYLIGLIAHHNLSVPTSIYMFASYGIPVIGLDIIPVNSIIKEYGIGEIWNGKDNLNYLIFKIRENIKQYQEKCKLFLIDNSWDKSALVHENVFK